MINKGTVLITDGWTRKSLSAVRSLGVGGLKVHIASHKRNSAALYSKYCFEYTILPHPKKHFIAYKEALLACVKKVNPECVIPFEEESCTALYDLMESQELKVNTLLPDRNMFEKAGNKYQTLMLAKELGIDIPNTNLCENHEEFVKMEHSYPVVVKPVSSSGSRGLKFLNSKADSSNITPSYFRDFGPVLIQERISKNGQGVGVGLLFQKGKHICSYSYKRLREFPVSGGPSTLRETTDDPVLIESAVKLLTALNWHGVAMVEFKNDPNNGGVKLMEINPRFWGSMHLGFVSGMNFPYLFYLVAIGENIPSDVGYKSGIICRWLLPGDVAHFLSNPNRFRIIPSFFQFRSNQLFYDDFMPGDLKGNIASWVCTFISIFDLETWKVGLFR